LNNGACQNLKKTGKKEAHFFSEKEALFLRKRSKIEWGVSKLSEKEAALYF
jgi:hypothetical protein